MSQVRERDEKRCRAGRFRVAIRGSCRADVEVVGTRNVETEVHRYIGRYIPT